MTEPISKELLGILESEGVGTVGTDLFAERMPDNPARCVSIVTYGGGMPEYTHDNNSVAYESPRVQVTARDATAAGAYSLADAAYRALGRRNAYTQQWLSVAPMSMPFLFNRDAQERVLYMFNIEGLRRAG